MNKEDVIKNKSEAIKIITDYLDSCLATDNDANVKKVNIISYWLKDYIQYIKEESKFNPVNLKTYERGDIIKVNLGFNIGSELGGLHYCVVIDKKNNRNSPVVTVVPLSSQKTDKVNKNSIVLGNDIYKKLNISVDVKYNIYYNVLRIHLPCNISCILCTGTKEYTFLVFNTRNYYFMKVKIK